MFSISKLFHRSKPIPLYEVTHGAYQYYISKVKGNRGLSYATCQKKLTRDILCSDKVNSDNRFDTYGYGNLMIGVSKKNNKITWIQNNKWWNKSPYIIDEKKKNKLNKQLGINENTFKVFDVQANKVTSYKRLADS